MSVPFVGRRAELETLGDAVRGAHRVVVVTGDAGVGKTRLVSEAARASVNGIVGNERRHKNKWRKPRSREEQEGHAGTRRRAP